MTAYSLEGDVKSYAIDNTFTREMSKVCYALGKQLRPFCFLADGYQKKHQVIDLSTFGGFDDATKTLFDDIVSMELDLLKKEQIQFNQITDELKRTLFIRYMLATSICYVEVEKWKTVQGVSTPTYDKMLCTINPKLMAAWTGELVAETQGKYSKRIKTVTGELADGTLRFVKLQQKAQANTITVPRSQFNSKDIRCIPLFMMYAFQEGLYPTIQSQFVEFTFLKDNHTERTMVTTLDENLLMQCYNDKEYVDTMLSGIDVKTVKQGSMLLSSKIHRGYIKVPEVGASRYDSTGTRSLNMARLLTIKTLPVEQLDLSYVDIDLSAVVETFERAIDTLKDQPDTVREVWNGLNAGNPEDPGKDITDTKELINLCVKKTTDGEMLLSTTYQRWLHTFMIDHPHWFPLYTGLKGNLEDFAMAGADEFVEVPPENFTSEIPFF